MPDEVAIRALASAHRPGAPVAVHRRRRGLAPAGRRVSHPGGAAHRRRPAARPTTRRRQLIDASTRVPKALRECEPTRRRDLLVDHIERAGRGGDGTGAAGVARPVGGLLPTRYGFADERDTSAPPQRKPRRSTARAVVFDYPTVEALTDYLATILPELDRGRRRGERSTTTTTSPKTNCCNNFPKGWVEGDGCCTAGCAGRSSPSQPTAASLAGYLAKKLLPQVERGSHDRDSV